MNPIRAATVATADLAGAVARYGDWLGYRSVESGVIDPSLALAFGAPAIAGSRFALLRPESGRKVDLRLIEGGATPGYLPLRSYGWAALEICVRDVHAVHERLRHSPFEIIGPPAAIGALPTIHPMQVVGPDGDVLFLTEIVKGGPGSGLPTAQSAIDTTFIAVLGCRDMAAEALWTGAIFDAEMSPDIAIPYRTLSRAFGLPSDTIHFIRTATHEDHIFIEVDQYPAGAIEREPGPTGLAPGVAMMSFHHPDLDRIEWPWLAPPIRREGPLYGGARSGTLRSPQGTLFELVEARP